MRRGDASARQTSATAARGCQRSPDPCGAGLRPQTFPRRRPRMLLLVQLGTLGCAVLAAALGSEGALRFGPMGDLGQHRDSDHRPRALYHRFAWAYDLIVDRPGGPD